MSHDVSAIVKSTLLSRISHFVLATSILSLQIQHCDSKASPNSFVKIFAKLAIK